VRRRQILLPTKLISKGRAQRRLRTTTYRRGRIIGGSSSQENAVKNDDDSIIGGSSQEKDVNDDNTHSPVLTTGENREHLWEHDESAENNDAAMMEYLTKNYSSLPNRDDPKNAANNQYMSDGDRKKFNALFYERRR
jgi:hypothetical protein